MQLSPLPSDTSAPGPERSSLRLRDVGGILLTRWRLFAGVTAGVTLAVIGLTLLITPVWESEASLRVKMDGSEGMGSGMLGGLSEISDITSSLPGGISLPGGLGESEVDTEIGVLGSRRILERMADSLALHITLKRPWGAFRTDVLHVLEAGEEDPKGTYSLRRQSDGTYTVSARGTREPVSLPDRVTIGEPFQVGPMTLELIDSLAADPPSLVRFSVKPFRRMMRSLRRQVKIERSDEGSRLVEIRYRNPDPYVARAFVNGVVDDFMEYSLSTGQSDSRRRATILEEEVARYARLLSDAETRLQAFQEANLLIAPDEQASQQVQRIAQVQVRYDAARVERSALSRALADLSRREPGPTSETPYRSLASFPTFLTNQGVQQLLVVLSDLENQRAQLLTRRTEANVDVVALDGRIREIEEQIHSVASEYLDGLDTQIASAQAALDEFGDDLEAVPAVELEYARLTRDQRLLSEVYLMLHAQLVDAQVQEAIDDAQARVVDLGVIEDRPAFPRRSITFALAGMMGLMVGLFTVVSVETSDPRIRSAADAARAGGAPLLAAVPPVNGRKARQALFLRDAPQHAASERVRALALQLRRNLDGPAVIVLGGASAEEGRSTVAANLALAFSRLGARTALVDADLRSGALDRWFARRDASGWASLAAQGADPLASRQPVDEGATGGLLDLFPAGRVSMHPLEVLVTPQVPTFIERLRAAYDLVVIDTPPLADGHDAAVMAGLADGTILVARAERSAEAALADAAEAFRRSGPVLGVVLTEADD